MASGKPTDMRKQRLFVVLSSLWMGDLDAIAREAAVTRQFAAKEMERLGWIKASGANAGQYFHPGRTTRPAGER